MSKLATLEAMLFTTSAPIGIEELEKSLKAKREDIERLLDILRHKYSSPESGIKLSEGGGGYRLVVKHEYSEKVSHLTPHADLSRGVLRVLSIIAYHEPIAQSDIVKIVGNRTYEYVRELQLRGLIRTEKKSRTQVLRTTPHFEDYFGAKTGEIRRMAEEKIGEQKKKN
jgi:segregation and condensation protein B